MNNNGLEIGDCVKMVNCAEDKLYPDKIWKVRSKPWKLGCGIMVILLEGNNLS